MSSPTRRVFLQPIWLISPGRDLCFLIGSVALSWGLGALWWNGQLSGSTLLLLWIFGFHGPHFWAQISRTYLDPSERAQRGPLLRRTLWWFAVGPALVGASLLIEARTGNRDLEYLFFFMAALWAYHHVIKQHFGFMALYRAKAREFDKREFALHKYYLIYSLWIPVLLVLLNSPFWVGQIPGVGLLRTVVADAQLGQAIGFLSLWLERAFWLLQLGFALHLVLRVLRGRALNLPELLIVLTSVSLHYWLGRACLAAGLRPGAGPLDAYAFVPLATLFHNVQYHALVWHYNRVKYRGPKAVEFYGWAARVNRSFGVYLACGLFYTALTIGLEYYPFWSLFDRGTNLGRLLVAFLWGVSFLHYYVDGEIWHVRSDPNLRRVLGFPEPPASAQSAARPATG